MRSELAGFFRPFLLCRNRGCGGGATKSHIRLRVARLLQLRRGVLVPGFHTNSGCDHTTTSPGGPMWVKRPTRPEQGTNSAAHWDVRDQKGAGPATGWQFSPEPPVLQLSQKTDSVLGQHSRPHGPRKSCDLALRAQVQPVIEAVGQQGNVASQQIILCALQDERNAPGPHRFHLLNLDTGNNCHCIARRACRTIG